MVKILEAGPGDLVEVNDSYQVIINNASTIYRGLDQAKRIGQEKDSFVGKGKLGKDEFWFMGTHSLSFDSRYYGAVSLNQVIGRAYPIL
jgi:conjugal transfer pilin signal peptidase TrbI